VHRCSKRSALLGMVNTVRKEGVHLVGDIFDGESVVAALNDARVPLAGRQVTVIGCGGLGSAAAFAVLEQQAASVCLVDTQAARAAALARLLCQHFGAGSAQACAEPSLQTEVLLHCSPIGMNDTEAMACDVERLKSLRAVVDGAASAQPSALMRAAASRGMPVLGGRAIARAQWHSILDFWDNSPHSTKETTT
jgi:shikimate dehydrogenase